MLASFQQCIHLANIGGMSTLCRHELGAGKRTAGKSSEICVLRGDEGQTLTHTTKEQELRGFRAWPRVTKDVSLSGDSTVLVPCVLEQKWARCREEEM